MRCLGNKAVICTPLCPVAAGLGIYGRSPHTTGRWLSSLSFRIIREV